MLAVSALLLRPEPANGSRVEQAVDRVRIGKYFVGCHSPRSGKHRVLLDAHAETALGRVQQIVWHEVLNGLLQNLLQLSRVVPGSDLFAQRRAECESDNFLV